MFLTRPSEQYRESFIESIREAHAESRHTELHLPYLERHFADYLRSISDKADVRHLLHGWVAESYFWLIDGGEYIGTTRLRHELNDRLRVYGGNIGYEIRPSKRRQGYGKLILRLALDEARKIGLTRALVTCDRENIGSRKIIEGNGGVFEAEEPVMVLGKLIHERRYWVPVPEEPYE